jgi:hypothetical protein
VADLPDLPLGPPWVTESDTFRGYLGARRRFGPHYRMGPRPRPPVPCWPACYCYRWEMKLMRLSVLHEAYRRRRG